MGIEFITLRRRSPKMLPEIHQVPASAWRRIELEGVARAYRTPRILDQHITLDDYHGPHPPDHHHRAGARGADLPAHQPTRRSPAKLIDRYAQRMIIENSISDGIDFFHMDALSSAVAMKVNCDLQLTLMASSLYRLLGARIGAAYATAESRHVFRDFINATAHVTVGDRDITVRFQKRAHNPLLVAAGFDEPTPHPLAGQQMPSILTLDSAWC